MADGASAAADSLSSEVLVLQEGERTGMLGMNTSALTRHPCLDWSAA